VTGETRLVDLEALVQAVEFPFAASAPVRCAVAGNELHTLARDMDSGRVRHLALDGLGQAARAPAELPASFVMGLASGPDVLAATVTMQDGETPALLVLDVHGNVQQVAPLSPPEPLAVWPVPLVREGAALAVMATAAHRLHLVTWSSAATTLTEPIQLGDATVELAAVPLNGDVVLARVHGEGLALELIRLDLADGKLRSTVDAADQAVLPGVHVVGDRLALVWTSSVNGQAWLQWYDDKLRLQGSAHPLTHTAPGERVRSARLFVGSGGVAAVSYVTARSAEQIVPPTGDGPSTMRASQAYAHFVASYDALRDVVGPVHPVAEPGVVFHDGGWLARRLIVLHGSRAPAVSVFGPRA
jgi:hypothetical protein